jgi:DNA topoisomerase-1
MILFIVESPTKCSTIQKYLGKEYLVIATCGHFMDLDTKTISIDKNTWTPQFKPTKNNIIQKIKDANKNCNTVYISTDNDTEGNGIGYHISKIVKGDVYRVTYNEITKSAIMDGIQNKHRLNMNIVNAYLTRRMIDRIVGYGISPLLWKRFGINTLSAGRVQSVVLALILQKQNETENNETSLLYDVKADFTDFTDFTENKHKLSNTIYSLSPLKNYKDAVDIVNILPFDVKWKVQDNIKDKIIKPPPPFITSSIQMACSSLFKLSNKATMDILQKLFEKGLITYHRTSYLNISNQFRSHAKEYIQNTYGDNKFVSRYGSNDSNSAHECIRVTNLNTQHDDKIYKLIWKRTIQSLMIPALYDEHNIQISHNDIQFCSTINTLKDPGYLIVENKTVEPPLKLPKTVTLTKSWVEPKSSVKLSYYDESSIIKKMETCDIGRPSTYASTIEHLFYKGYIEYSTNPSRKTNSYIYTKTMNNTTETPIEIDACSKGNNRMLHVTDIGSNIIMFLYDRCDFLLSTQLTANMENNLDNIENNTIQYKDVLTEFNTKLEKVIAIPTEQKKLDTNALYIHTKYGRCIKNDDGKLINIEGVLKHLKRSINTDDNSKHFVSFIKSLPINLDADNELHTGRYGLYIKNKNKNIKIEYKQLKTIREKFNI